MDGDDVMEYIEPGDEGARIGLAVPCEMLVADWASMVNSITSVRIIRLSHDHNTNSNVYLRDRVSGFVDLCLARTSVD